MAGMVSLKRSPEEMKKETGPVALSDYKPPAYGYDTRICLDDEVLKRMGVKVLPDAETKFTAKITGFVSSARSNARAGGKNDRSVELQVTDIKVSWDNNVEEAERTGNLLSPTKGD